MDNYVVFNPSSLTLTQQPLYIVVDFSEPKFDNIASYNTVQTFVTHAAYVNQC